MRILITGGSGFIGAFLGRYLSGPRREIHLTSRRLALGETPAVDLCGSFPHLGSYDVVIHAAGLCETSVRRYPDLAYHRINALGTGRMLRKVSARHVLYISSAKVYPPLSRREMWTEGQAAPEGAYARSLWRAEQRVLRHPGGTVLRCCNIFGDGQASGSLIPDLIRRARAGETLPLLVSPRSRLQFLGVEDLAQGVEAWLAAPRPGVFNLAPAGAVTLGAIVEIIRSLCGSVSEVEYPGEPAYLSRCISSRVFRNVYGWAPKAGVWERLAELCGEDRNREADRPASIESGTTADSPNTPPVASF